MQTPSDRLLLRAARRIQDSLLRRDSKYHLALPRPEWQDCADLHRKLIRAQSAGLSLAGIRLRTHLSSALDQLHRRICDHLDHYAVNSARVPTVRDLFEDLRGLRSEFTAVKLDFPNRVLAVATEPIELEDVELGAFLIQLPWTDRCDQYRVVALDPNPARPDTSHPHPHVSGDRLCEGEGRSQIRRALDHGRLFDFFVLVRQVLRNYNPESAYVTLDEWDCETCSGCGNGAAAEQMYCCSACDDRLCPACLTSCSECCRDLCHACPSSCESCGGMTTHCARCIGECEGCRRTICEGCREEGFCAACEPDSANSTPSISSTAQVDDD